MIYAISATPPFAQAQSAQATTASGTAFTLSEEATPPDIASEQPQDRADPEQSSHMQEALLQARAAEVRQTDGVAPAADEGAAAAEHGADAAAAGAVSADPAPPERTAPAGTTAAGDAASEKKEMSDADRKKAARKAAQEIEESFDRIKQLLAHRVEVPEVATGSQAAASAWAASRKVLGISPLPTATASTSATST